MQKTFLVLQVNYTTFQIGLFKQATALSIHTHDKKVTSKLFIPAIEAILKENNLWFDDLAFIGVNKGPGPFTSARVAITTVNALNFATGLPLVGVNSLYALLNEYDPQLTGNRITIALLNAFNKDLNYAFYKKNNSAEYPEEIEIGCKNHLILFDQIKDNYSDHPIRFIGLGADLFKEEITKLFGASSLPEDAPKEASLKQIAHDAYQKYLKNDTHDQITPLYLKPLSYKPFLR